MEVSRPWLHEKHQPEAAAAAASPPDTGKTAQGSLSQGQTRPDGVETRETHLAPDSDTTLAAAAISC